MFQLGGPLCDGIAWGNCVAGLCGGCSFPGGLIYVTVDHNRLGDGTDVAEFECDI